VVEKLRDLYNTYGTCNVAACDLKSCLHILRPVVLAEHPGRLAGASFTFLGAASQQDSRHFQNTLLGFLECGYQWMKQMNPSARNIPLNSTEID
jgi:hypothetical protein